MSNLIVADVAIRRDEEGRYCLNDLHRAAGGESRHQSAFFMKRPETVELIAELSNSAVQKNYTPVVSKAGRYGGTYVCKELVYAYAMWISPAFHLKVIRAYDQMVTGGAASAPTIPQTLPEALRLAADLAEKNLQLTHERNGVVKTIGKYAHTINQVVRKLDGVNTNATKGDLKRLGYLYKLGPGAYRKHNHLFTERFDEDTGRGNIYCTPEGKALLARLYEEGKLTMKAGYRVA